MEKEKELRLRRIKAKETIEQQMRDKEERIRTDAAAVAQLEKQQIDDIMRKIQEEDEEEIRQKHIRQAKIQSFIKQYWIDKQARIKREKEDEKLYEEKIRREAAVQDERDRQVIERRDELQARRDVLYNQLCEEANKKIAEEKEMERYRELLYIEEEEQRLRLLEQERLEKQHRMMQEMMRANEEMQAMKADKVRKEKEEEEQIAEMMKRKFEEDLRKEREEFERRQQEKILYRGEITDQIKKRQEAYRIELEREQFEIDQEKRRQAFKAKVVEEARKRLLMQHGKELKEYLPRGVIRDQEEYNLIYNS